MAAVRIYTGENVNPAIAEGLRRRGVDARSASEVRNLSLPDDAQLQYASEHQAVLFTHDADLLLIGSRWSSSGRGHWGIVYVHPEKLSIGECVQRLKDLTEVLTAEEMMNRVEYM